jgi:TIR domain
MGYVPGFEWDIFLSYPMEAEAWAKRFEEDLLDGGRLAAARGLRIFFAQRDWQLGAVSDDMLEAARRSAVFVAVITRDSLFQTEKRFLQREMEAFTESGPLKRRFCPISLEPIDASELTRAMPIASSHAFWNMAEFYFKDRGIPQWLEPDTERDRGSYKRAVRRVAHQLRDRLDELIPGALPASDIRGAFSGRTVFLARIEPNSHVLTEWEHIRKLLENDGATVVPNERSDSDATAVQTAELFVQLLSPLDSLDAAKAQFELAERHKIPLLQWRQKTSKADLERLDQEGKRFYQGAHVQTGPLQDFKARVRDELDKIGKQLEKIRDRTEDSATPDRESASSQKPYLYITADTVDIPLARQLQVAARRRTVADVMVQDEQRRRDDFEEGLRQAGGMVFLYGGAEPQFIDRWLKEFVRKSRLLNVNPKVSALYLAPPERNEAEEPLVPTEELRTLGSHKEFTVQGIEKICAELCGDPV